MDLQAVLIQHPQAPVKSSQTSLFTIPVFGKATPTTRTPTRSDVFMKAKGFNPTGFQYKTSQTNKKTNYENHYSKNYHVRSGDIGTTKNINFQSQIKEGKQQIYKEVKPDPTFYRQFKPAPNPADFVPSYPVQLHPQRQPIINAMNSIAEAAKEFSIENKMEPIENSDFFNFFMKNQTFETEKGTIHLNEVYISKEFQEYYNNSYSQKAEFKIMPKHERIMHMIEASTKFNKYSNMFDKAMNNIGKWAMDYDAANKNFWKPEPELIYARPKIINGDGSDSNGQGSGNLIERNDQNILMKSLDLPTNSTTVNLKYSQIQRAAVEGFPFKPPASNPKYKFGQ